MKNCLFCLLCMVALFFPAQAQAQDNRNLAVTMANKTTSEKMRGGSWSNDAQGLRAAKRNDNFPAYRGSYRGFRVARTLP